IDGFSNKFVQKIINFMIALNFEDFVLSNINRIYEQIKSERILFKAEFSNYDIISITIYFTCNLYKSNIEELFCSFDIGKKT
ncbi:MAG: hypothetical protein ACFFDN_34830, partial [Candidatus Hodarchaeota archaeon]